MVGLGLIFCGLGVGLMFFMMWKMRGPDHPWWCDPQPPSDNTSTG